mgnify:CR=1 FL=1
MALYNIVLYYKVKSEVFSVKECPNCRQSLKNDDMECPGCGYRYPDSENTDNEEWVHLTSVANEIEYELMAGLLETGNIPVTMRSIGVDRFVGVPMAGIEVMVPAHRYDEAVQIINTEIDEDTLIEEEIITETEDTEEKEDGTAGRK